MRYATIILGLAASVFLMGPASDVAAKKVVPSSGAQLQLSFAPVVRDVAPAVVNIFAKKVVRRRVDPFMEDPFFRRFFGDGFFGGGGGRTQQRTEQSLGSGVIVSPDGMIVTNHHVVGGADEIRVVLSDRRELDAKVILSDEELDLAVLQVDPEGKPLPSLPFRDSNEVEVGDLVLAIGNPFGVGQSVSSGIISAVSRTQATQSGTPQSYLQTDAAINPGNSGGALVTLDGKLVGVNTMIFSKSGGSLGIGFAIPANLVRAFVNGARSGMGLVRPWIGVAGQDLTAGLAAGMGLAVPGGVLVNEVYDGGPGAKAGLRVGDVILAIEGRDIRDPGDMRFRLLTAGVGRAVDLTVWRQGKQLKLPLALQAAPENPPRNVRELKGDHPLRGAEVGNLSPAFAQEIGADAMTRGVIVLGVQRRSVAARFGVRPGDVILRSNGQAIHRVKGLDQMLSKVRREWNIEMKRGNRVVSVEAVRNSR